MHESYDKLTAVVVLPPVGGGRLRHSALRTWLAQSDLYRESHSQELLARVLAVLRLPYPNAGRAALRMWGQTGDRPPNWIAAADPVFLEAHLDRLCLHALQNSAVTPQQLRALLDYLQKTLCADGQFGFTRLGNYGYVSAKRAFATASVPSCLLDRQAPNEFLPGGEGAAAHRKLLSEIEMALHDHEVNRSRIESGQQPVNSLWLWGGGVAPEQTTRPQPPLFSNDALLTGYWLSATAVAESWPGSINACLEQSVAGFVAEFPESSDDEGLVEKCLLELRAALQSRRLNRLILLFRDGIRADIERAHAFRIWRRDSELLSAADQR